VKRGFEIGFNRGEMTSSHDELHADYISRRHVRAV
jgi:hypothetical protein